MQFGNEGLPKVKESRGDIRESVRSPGETSIILKDSRTHPPYAYNLFEKQKPKKEEGLGGRTNRRRSRIEGIKDQGVFSTLISRTVFWLRYCIYCFIFFSTFLSFSSFWSLSCSSGFFI